MPELTAALDHVDGSLALVALAVGLREAQSREEAYRLVASAAVDLVPGCDHSSVMVLEHRRSVVMAASDTTALAFDLLQQDVGEGPGLTTLHAAVPVAVTDLSGERRWPVFTAQALAASPVRAVLAHPLMVGSRPGGVLALFGRRAGAFDDGDVEAASLVAGYAAVALANVEEIRQLREALASRDLISTAKGVLMGRQGMSEELAFDALRRASRRSNVKVRELARSIVAGSGGDS